MISGKPLILDLIKKILIVFLIYAICRILFYYFNKSSFQELGLLEFTSLLFYGLRFDAFSICALNSLYILLTVLPFNFQKTEGYKKTLFYVFIITNSIGILFNFIDFSYFPFTQKRTTYDVVHLIFGGQTELIKLLPHFLLDSWYLILIYTLLIILLIKAYNTIEKKKQFIVTSLHFKTISLNLFGFLLVAGFTLLGIRGGLQRIPIVFLDAALYTNQKYIPIVINTPFSLLKSIELNQIEELHFYKEKELKKYSSQIIKADTGAFKNLNVCVIILESFSKEFTKYGNRKSYTPFLDSLISISTYCSNAIANGKTSINGLPSIMASMPTYMDDPYLNSTYANNTLNALPLLLKQKGYHTSFFHGATNGSMNFDSYSKSAGYDIYYGRTEYNKDSDYDGQWGIYDEPFLINMVSELSKYKQPFLTTVFTLSSHHPYSIPEKYKEKFPKGKLENIESIGYADYSLRQFFLEAQKKPWFNNTIFVLSADHTAISEDEFYANQVGQYAIPIIFYIPNQKPQQITKVVQQTDIMPTILDLLNYDKTYYAFGKSIFSNHNLPAVYYSSPNYKLINDSMMFIFNDYKITEVYKYKTDSNLTKPLQGQYLKEETEASNYFKALQQNYNNDVINNKTHY